MPTQELLSPKLQERIKELMASYPKPQSAILMALHLIQEELGWVPEPAQAQVAELFGMPPQDVTTLVSFYYMYHRKPVGRYVLKVCKSISCYLCGSQNVIDHLEKKLDIKMGETTADGQFSLVGSECLAACTGAPCLQVNDRFYENCSQERLDELLSRLRGGDSHFPPANVSWQPPKES
ncbi:MAG: NADH-quinone oxidoreductase subunit NuoE [Candidatus Eremiobacteraeota bacterium]|nr:NADH-quinone oxidoreductase subunit NuoE [Candidatus Eremiobacteraeota bacterium]MCW5869490.1 NADH-quinone oxidoreductase subunit NuoE [Candidatus Eremiobacteraeota bacterium]